MPSAMRVETTPWKLAREVRVGLFREGVRPVGILADYGSLMGSCSFQKVRGSSSTRVLLVSSDACPETEQGIVDEGCDEAGPCHCRTRCETHDLRESGFLNA